jgi:hypothetical protein
MVRKSDQAIAKTDSVTKGRSYMSPDIVEEAR